MPHWQVTVPKIDRAWKLSAAITPNTFPIPRGHVDQEKVDEKIREHSLSTETSQ
jgi:hypothetical protein